MPDKRPQILEAAEGLFMSHRFHEVTVDDVAKKAGVGKGTIYRYFKDKENLFHQIVLTGMDQLTASLEQPPDKKISADNEIQYIIRKIVEFFSKRRSLFGLMHSAQIRRSWRKKNLWHEWREKNEHRVDAVAAMIERGIKEGRYRSTLDPKMAARLLLGMVRSALWHKDEIQSNGKLIKALSELFEKGIRK